MTALYKDGTVTLVQGSSVIVGNDTGWKVALIVGGTVFVEAEGGAPLPILPDDSNGANLHPITNTQMTAAIKWTGASGTYNYAIVRDMSYSRQQSANADALALLLQRLNNPSLAAISGVVPEEDSLILLTGPSTATTIQRKSLGSVIGPDETVAGYLAAFDTADGKKLRQQILSAFAATILDDPNGAAMFATMGGSYSGSEASWALTLPNGVKIQGGRSTHAIGTGDTEINFQWRISFSEACAIALVNAATWAAQVVCGSEAAGTGGAGGKARMLNSPQTVTFKWFGIGK